MYLRGEWKQSQIICDEIEDAFGLRKDTPGRAGAMPRQAAGRPEIDQTWAADLPVTDREMLRRESVPRWPAPVARRTGWRG
ncbi:hypothetical protein [Actinoplanes xinjiangensis]|uniref:hypothetical protein n=1 Tax=Actinoplanes xinjiangensis TaxID=512350 RepID=UPI003428C322